MYSDRTSHCKVVITRFSDMKNQKLLKKEFMSETTETEI